MPLRILRGKGAVQIMPFQKLGRKFHFFLRFCTHKRSKTYINWFLCILSAVDLLSPSTILVGVVCFGFVYRLKFCKRQWVLHYCHHVPSTTRMYSSRMSTARDSSHPYPGLRGLPQRMLGYTHPPTPRCWPGDLSLGVGLEIPLGVGLETPHPETCCTACWDTPLNRMTGAEILPCPKLHLRVVTSIAVSGSNIPVEYSCLLSKSSMSVLFEVWG